MGVSAFQVNATFYIDGREFELIRKVSEDLWQLEEAKTKRVHEKTDVELRTLYVEGRLVFGQGEETYKGRKIGKSHREVPRPLMADAKVRRAYAVEAMNGPSTQSALEDVAKRIWAKVGKPDRCPHWTSVYRWRKSLIGAGRDINGVVAQIDKRGNRTRRFPQPVVDIVEQAIDSEFLTLERKTVQDTLDEAITNVRRENNLRPKGDKLPIPTRRFVQGLIDEIPAFDKCTARYGRDIALRRFRSVQGHRSTDAPLERAEIDHTLMDLMVVDDDSGLPLGRPLLTACIDDYSRCVLGISIGFEPPSFLTAARCLKHALLPKTSLKADYPTIDNEWDAHGVMRELSMDNGQEFHSDSLEEGCLSLGIEIHYAPRKTPWFKGKIERFQGTLNNAVAHSAPGTTFSNIFEKGDYDPVKHAVVRLSTLRHVVHKWIVDVYHQRPHRSLKVAPAALWKSSIRTEDILLPEDPQRLDAVLGRRAQRVLTHKGIEFEGLFYNSPELKSLRDQLGEKLDVEICINDGDIGSIIVLSPDKKRMFVAPALALAYAKGMTAWQHKVCKRFAASNLKEYDSTAWLEAKAQIAELIRKEFAWHKKTKPRGGKANKANSRTARYLNGGDQPPEGAGDSTPSSGTSAPPAGDQKTSAPAVLPQPTPALSAPASSPANAIPVLPAPMSTRQFTPVKRLRHESPGTTEY